MQEIVEWRKRIDEIDRLLLTLLNERAKYALEIGRIKKISGIPVQDANREKEIYARLREMNEGPFSDEAVENLFGCLISESRRLERET
jgi:chorismate mutase